MTTTISTSSSSTPNMTPRSAPSAFATSWAFLKEGMDRIMTKLLAGVSYDEYIKFYSVAYSCCTSGHHNNGNTYDSLVHYFHVHLEGLKDVRNFLLLDVDLLRFYVAQWDRYSHGAVLINRVFHPLNIGYIKAERDHGYKSVYPVYTLALACWKSSFFLHVQSKDRKLTRAILRLIKGQRNGEIIDQDLIKQVVDSLVSLGLDETDVCKVSLDLYKEHLESPFLIATERYYEQESKTFLAEKGLSDYLKKAEERLREEEDRVHRYLNMDTRKQLVSKCEHVLIRRHSELMWDSFQNILDLDKDEDMRRMSALLSRISGGLEPIRKKFEEHVRKAGLTEVSKLVGEGSESADGLDLRAYIDTLSGVHRRNSETVTHSFRGEAGFVASLDRACREFVNYNAATTKLRTGSPVLLAKYVDGLLRTNQMTEGDVEGAFNRVVTLLKYIEDKDVFYTSYARKLSERLIHGVSTSDENERNMISKLREACDCEDTNKLRGMFTDMVLSKELTAQFKKQMQQNHDNIAIDLSVMVFSVASCSLDAPNDYIIVPPEIRPVYDLFLTYYRTKHPGRRLTWLWSYSKNELRTNYLNQKYILMASSHQTAVLLQYNTHDTLSLEELESTTAISKDNLLQALSPLVDAKIHLKNENGQYDLNFNFRSKKIRVNVNKPIRANVEAESSRVIKAVNEGRKYVIQATIVRIMKARKTMEYQPLVQEVVLQISQRFAPKVPDIKKAIDTLLEREYIERVNGRLDEFAYIAL